VGDATPLTSMTATISTIEPAPFVSDIMVIYFWRNGE
jgi:hypothetical protein